MYIVIGTLQLLSEKVLLLAMKNIMVEARRVAQKQIWIFDGSGDMCGRLL